MAGAPGKVYVKCINFNSLQPNQTGSQQIQRAINPSAKSNTEEEESRIRKLEKIKRKKGKTFSDMDADN